MARISRQVVVNSIVEFCRDNGLGQPYLDSGMSPDRRFRWVIFSRPLVFDGEVRVYGPNWLYLSFQTQLHGLPQKGRFNFKCVGDLFLFLRLALVDRNYELALEIPRQTTKKGISHVQRVDGPGADGAIG